MSNNVIAKMLRGMGIAIIILGFFAYAIIGIEVEDMVVFISGTGISIIAGMIIIGFSEIIDLLQKNLNKQTKIAKKSEESSKGIMDKANINL